jgi:hypothetical protein
MKIKYIDIPLQFCMIIVEDNIFGWDVNSFGDGGGSHTGIYGNGTSGDGGLITFADVQGGLTDYENQRGDGDIFRYFSR